MQRKVFKKCVDLLLQHNHKDRRDEEERRKVIARLKQEHEAHAAGKSSENLNFHEFSILFTINIIAEDSDTPFVFKHTRLCFDVMNDGSGATRELWKRFACWMFPLANSKNTSKIYDLLANFEETVTWERFQDYVQQLETQWKKKPPSEMQPSFRNRMKEDRYLYKQSSIADYSAFPHVSGMFLLTDYHLVFVAKKQSRLLNLQRIRAKATHSNGFFSRDNSIEIFECLESNSVQQTKFTLNGIYGTRKLRDRLIFPITVMVDVHTLALHYSTRFQPHVFRSLIRETANDILRMNALLDLDHPCDFEQTKDIVLLYRIEAGSKKMKDYLQGLEEAGELAKRSMKKQQDGIINSLGEIFSGRSRSLTDPSISLKLQPYRADSELLFFPEKPFSFEETSTVEFDHKKTQRLYKILAIQTKPFSVLRNLFFAIVEWHNFALSFTCMLLLIFIGYFELVGYIPGLLMLFNLIVLLLMKSFPAKVEDFLKRVVEFVEDESKKRKIPLESKKDSIFHPLFNLQLWFQKGKGNLAEVQLKMEYVTNYLGRFHSIYVWADESITSQICFVHFVCLCLLAFFSFSTNWIFAVVYLFYWGYKRGISRRKKAKGYKGKKTSFFERIPITIPASIKLADEQQKLRKKSSRKKSRKRRPELSK